MNGAEETVRDARESLKGKALRDPEKGVRESLKEMVLRKGR